MAGLPPRHRNNPTHPHRDPNVHETEAFVMLTLRTIPNEPSALITIFRSQGDSVEFMATLAIDTYSLPTTPIGECVRVDIDTLGSLPLALSSLLHLLGTLEPLFPSAGHLVGIFEDGEEGRIIRVALRRTDHAPVLGPVDKGVTGVGRGCHRLRTAFRKFAPAADRAISTGRRPDRDLVLLRVDGQPREDQTEVIACERQVNAAGCQSGLW
jgi:hypothetical protein